jgi:CRISPR type III-A-associated protein Csm2
MPDNQRVSFFDENYLRDGYFDRDSKSLRPDVVDKLAFDAAAALVNAHTKTHQLRRFYNQLRAIERSLGPNHTFEQSKAQIKLLKPFAAYQVGRDLVWGDFKRFIDRNVDLAVQSENNFRHGCIPHLQAVLGYFVFKTRGRQ